MTRLRVLFARWRGRGRSPEELASEITGHLSLLAGEFERRGLSPADARMAARRHFGPVTQLEERYREQRRLPVFDTFGQDLAYALRQLRHNPAFAAAAVLTLALGIGANTAIYQVLDAVVFRSLPVRDPARLVQIQLVDNNQPMHVSYPFYRELAARQSVLDGMFAVSDFPLREAVLRGRGAWPFGFVLYVPLTQDPAPVTAVLVRPKYGAHLATAVRAVLHEVDPTLFVGSIHPVGDSVEARLSNEKLLALLSACFGVLALGLTAVGVYGVISYAVQRRTQVIGIRLALGAEPGAVRRMMMRDVTLLALSGTLLGAVGGLAATRALRTMLFAFAPADYSLRAGAGTHLFLVAASAGYIPSLRAARLDPMSALRQE